MTFSSLPGMEPFGDLFHDVELANPYEGPGLPAFDLQEGVQRSLLGVQMQGGGFLLNSDDPLAVYSVANHQWSCGIRKLIVDALSGRRATVTLLVDDPSLLPRAIDARALDSIDPSRLRFSIFEVLDFRIQPLIAYNGAKILLATETAQELRRALMSKSVSGGRPVHPMKAWYAERGYQRNGLSVGTLQAEFKKATGKEPASPTAIRNWERLTDL